MLLCDTLKYDSKRMCNEITIERNKAISRHYVSAQLIWFVLYMLVSVRHRSDLRLTSVSSCLLMTHYTRRGRVRRRVQLAYKALTTSTLQTRR